MNGQSNFSYADGLKEVEEYVRLLEAVATSPPSFGLGLDGNLTRPEVWSKTFMDFASSIVNNRETVE